MEISGPRGLRKAALSGSRFVGMSVLAAMAVVMLLMTASGASAVNITTAALPDAKVGDVYSQTLAAETGVEPYAWAVTAGGLPAGLALTAGTGVISGTPTAYGTETFTVQVTDSTGTPETDTQELTITVAPDDLVIETLDLPNGKVGVAYNSAIVISGGVPPYTGILKTGTWPQGLVASYVTGVINGTPTQYGLFTFSIQVSDSQATPATATEGYTVVIAPDDLSVTTAALAAGKVGDAYSETLAAAGGVTPYAWAVTAGDISADLTLDAATGAITGTPTNYGTLTFTVQVTDSATPAVTATAELSIVVVPGDLAITTTTFPDGKVGVAYSAQLDAAGGMDPLSGEVLSGALPTGLTMAALTGAITGTPTEHGTFTFVIQLSDASTPAQTDTAELSITVAPVDVAITTATLADGKVGDAYSEILAATGGVGPYAWAVTDGALPAGLALNAATGEISGTPTAYGTFAFTVVASDSQETPFTDSAALSMDVDPATLAVTTASLPLGHVDDAYAATLAVTGGAEPYTWAVTGGVLPDGLALNAATGAISGTPTTEGSATFTVTVTDSQATPATATAELTLAIGPAGDFHGPTVGNLAKTPSQIKTGVDDQVTITGTADDSEAGASNIAAAEYFIGTDPGEGLATAMDAADDTFDTATEAVTVNIDTTAWTVGAKTVSVRAKDASDNWGAVATVTVEVVDGTAPTAISDLTVTSVGTLEGLSSTVSDVTDEAAGFDAELVVDDDATTSWKTAGTVNSTTESVTIDLGAGSTVSAVSLEPAAVKTFFPATFQIKVSENGTDWTTVASVSGFKAVKGPYMWQFAPVSARFVMVSVQSVYSIRDKRYYAQIAEINTYGGDAEPDLDLAWTATGDDAAIGTASLYDIRISDVALTADNFDAATVVDAPAEPKAAGEAETIEISVPEAADWYVAIKAADEIPNWSAISNVVTVRAGVSGFAPSAPEDELSLDGVTAPTFAFAAGADVKPVFVKFSNDPTFLDKATKDGNGEIHRSLKFPVRPGVTEFTPSAGQWKSIKRLILSDGAIYWRLEGVSAAYGMVFGPSRVMFFDSGAIEDVTVDPVHGVPDAIWPVAAEPVTFSWTDNTTGMKFFFVDVSTIAEVPLTDKKHTITLGGAGIVDATTYPATKAEWKKIRQLAAGEDTIYVRVRAIDADRIMKTASGVLTVAVDAGELVLQEIDFASTPVVATWSSTGEGLVKFSIQFSADSGFDATARKTIKIPAVGIAGTTYTLSATDIARVRAMAVRNAVTSVYYRLRAEDAEGAFVAYGDAMETSQVN